MLRSSLLLAAIATLASGCVAQETGRFDLSDPIPWFNSASSGSIEGAATEGDARAARVLGDMYYWGDTVEPDRAKAEEYWVMASQGGDEVATQRLESLRNGQPIKVVHDGGGARRVTMGFWESTIEPMYDFDIDWKPFGL